MNIQNPPRAGTNGTGGRRRPPRTPKGRQVDPQRVRRDLWRLAEWERARATRRIAPEASTA